MAILVGIASSFLIFEDVQAAKVFFQKDNLETESVNRGEIFNVKLFLDSRGQNVNAVEGEIIFPFERVSFLQISQADSVVSYWVKSPQENQNGKIIFSGVIPGGYNGEKGMLFSVDFMAKEEGVAQLLTDSIKTFLNDGRGTELGTISSALDIIIESSIDDSNKEANAESAVVDNTAPESFEIAVSRHEDLFDGKWFISFYAKDNGSGINRYGVIESNRQIDFKKEVADSLEWIPAESPYLLNDQELQSYIYVRAIDNEGNETISSKKPQKEKSLLGGRNFLFVIGGTVLLIAVILVNITVRKRAQKRH